MSGEFTDLPELFESAIQAVSPERLVYDYVCARNWPTAITLIALGKSAVPMALGARIGLGFRVVEEVGIAPEIPADASDGWMASSHPKLSALSRVAASLLSEGIERAPGSVLVLISGGGSALAAMPAAGLSMEDKAGCLERVYASGATISELNVVRKHLSAIKGGGLARLTSCPMTTLVLSDVPGDAMASVSSGPTLVDPSTYAEAMAIVGHAYRHVGQPSNAILNHLNAGIAGQIPETAKTLPAHNDSFLLAGIDAVAKAATKLAQDSGKPVQAIPFLIAGSVEELAGQLASLTKRPGLWIGAGEATIELPPSLQPDKSRGGRAQHLALLLAREIQGMEFVQVLVAGSDGVDGNSDAAGAVVDGTSYMRMRRAGIEPEDFLARFDSASALYAIGAQIIVGATGVNHADIVMIEVGVRPSEL